MLRREFATLGIHVCYNLMVNLVAGKSKLSWPYWHNLKSNMNTFFLKYRFQWSYWQLKAAWLTLFSLVILWDENHIAQWFQTLNCLKRAIYFLPFIYFYAFVTKSMFYSQWNFKIWNLPVERNGYSSSHCMISGYFHFVAITDEGTMNIHV